MCVCIYPTKIIQAYFCMASRVDDLSEKGLKEVCLAASRSLTSSSLSNYKLSIPDGCHDYSQKRRIVRYSGYNFYRIIS